jgi:hypothetical protein
MKQLKKHILTSLLLTVVWAAGTAYAQISPVLRVNIPFQFNVGDRSFPPGQYSVVQPLQHFLVLRDARGNTIASTFTEGVETLSAPDISSLKFVSEGGQNTLNEVWTQYSSSGLKMFPSYNHSYIAKHRTEESRQSAEGSQP